MRKMLILFVLLFVLAGTTFSFAQVKLTPEQKRSNDREMQMRMIRNKDRDRSLEVAFVELDEETNPKSKNQVYQKRQQPAVKLDTFEMGFERILPMNESLELTPEELKDQQVRDSISDLKETPSLKDFEESMMIQKKNEEIKIEKEKEKKTSPLNLFVGALALLLVIFILSYKSKNE